MIRYIAKWILLSAIVALLIGSVSALFLSSLSWVTSLRQNNHIFVWLLPIGGLLIGFIYFFTEKGAEGGNNLLIKEVVFPERILHWKMAPLVLIGTLLTHLFGGSAGREGTAVQMGGAISDQFHTRFKLDKKERQILLRMGIAAGFGGVFGTPIAAFIFSIELIKDKNMLLKGLPWLAFSAFGADFICHTWNIEHSSYELLQTNFFDFKDLSFVVLAALCFGFAALFFNYLKAFLSRLFKKYVNFPPLRLFFGGVMLLIFVLATNDFSFLGLGIETIQGAFLDSSDSYVWLVKLLLTALTLGAGFKGGEATPLFFIGATLGSALAVFLPLDLVLLVSVGFVAVFAGATNTPLASAIMGAELFGWSGILYFLIATFIAYFITGKTSVYTAQVEHLKKYSVWRKKII